MSNRFFIRGKSVVVFAPSVASLTAPTRAEITAGVILSQPGDPSTNSGISAMTGFEAQNNPIPVPDLASDFDATIPGTNSANAPTITFYDDEDSTVKRDAIFDGAEGYLIIMRYGDVAGKRCQVWPVRVAAQNDDQNLGNEAAKYAVQFTPSSKPEKRATIPA